MLNTVNTTPNAAVEWLAKPASFSGSPGFEYRSRYQLLSFLRFSAVRTETFWDSAATASFIPIIILKFEAT
jgi:hypothetical protein